MAVSYGIINYINKAKLICSCNINSKANGSPIFNSSNNKLIGIYKNNSKIYIKGIFLQFIINQFIIIYYRNRNKSKNIEINLINEVEDNYKDIVDKEDKSNEILDEENYYEGEYEVYKEQKDIINGTIIICFDINSSSEENQSKPNNKSKKIKIYPNRIFDKFFAAHKTIEKKIYKTNDSELVYKFYVNLREKTLFQIRIINKLSIENEIYFNANSYIIFIDLESIETKEKLNFLLEYINSNYSIIIKIYIIGLYKNKIIEEYQKDELEKLLSFYDLNYQNFQIKYIEEQNNHFCFYEFINNKKYCIKKFLKKKIEDYNLFEILEKIINESYENSYGLEFDPFKRKYKSIRTGNIMDKEEYSKGACSII